MSTVLTTAIGHNKVVIDAIKPLDRAFPTRIRVPPEAMEGLRLEDWIDYWTGRSVV